MASYASTAILPIVVQLHIEVVQSDDAERDAATDGIARGDGIYAAIRDRDRERPDHRSLRASRRDTDLVVPGDQIDIAGVCLKLRKRM